MPNIHLIQEEIDQAHRFAEDVVGETYNRFNQNRQTRIDRIFYGKLGEIAKAGSLDHIQPVIIIFLYLFIYQRINFGVRWSI